MFSRLSFWLGLLCGLAAAFGARRRPPPPQADSDPLLDLVEDAVIVSDPSGAIIAANAAARKLFGQTGEDCDHLFYPSGQPVPPGQIPRARAFRAGQPVEGRSHVFLADGERRVLEVSARPRSNGAVCVFRDVTDRHESQTRRQEEDRRAQTLQTLGRRLVGAASAEEPTRGIVESAHALLGSSEGAQVRLYEHDRKNKRLTLLASAPDERPRRPKSHRQAQPPSLPFDAADPILWQVYVAREPFFGGTHSAWPLLAGGAAIGHLSLTYPAAAVESAGMQAALSQLCALAALALACRQEAAQAVNGAKQGEALREIARTVADRSSRDALADFVANQVSQAVDCEVCTLAVREKGRLRLAGSVYQDALLFPGRHPPDDDALIGAAAQEAARTGQTVLRSGLPNPALEAGLWRAFAGQSGRHTILSAPLTAGQGALTVLTAGDKAFSDTQIMFLETAAAMISAGRTDS